MAITLGSVVLSDAEVTDGIGFGDVAAAARLWVGHWPIALSAARAYVEPEEVPGLAAEALIGTIAAIAVGRGPREDLTAFVVAAVAELGEGDDPPSASRTATPPPEVFTSPVMTQAFAALPAEDQEILWLRTADEQTDQLIAEARHTGVSDAESVRYRALTALQRDYLAEHTGRADTAACRQAHGALAAAVTRASSLPGSTWVHLSECAWCTEAFHELAFSNVAINALVDRDAIASVVPMLEAVVAPAVVIPGLRDPGPLEPLATVTAGADATAPSSETAVPPAPSEPGGFHAAAVGGRFTFLRGRRARLAVGAALTAAAITLGVVVISHLDSPEGSLAAAQTEPEQEATVEPEPFESVAPPTTDGVPRPTLTAATPTPTPSATATPSAVPSATPSGAAPSAQPSTTPRPSTTPTPGVPRPTPTPVPTTAVPTPTPTAPPCNALQHLLGFC